jgi:hypothetical protein
MSEYEVRGLTDIASLTRPGIVAIPSIDQVKSNRWPARPTDEATQFRYLIVTPAGPVVERRQ